LVSLIACDIIPFVKRVLIQLTEQQLATLRVIAKKEGKPVAWQVRAAVEAYLKKK
jgi:hypothetical protein